MDPETRQPVFFDVLGQWVVCARADKAALAAGAALLLVLLRVHLNARLARRERERAPRLGYIAPPAEALNVHVVYSVHGAGRVVARRGARATSPGCGARSGAVGGAGRGRGATRAARASGLLRAAAAVGAAVRAAR